MAFGNLQIFNKTGNTYNTVSDVRVIGFIYVIYSKERFHQVW